MTTSITAFPITAKQIAELTSASSAAGTDFLMAQQGTTGTAYRKMTISQIMGAGAAVLASGVTVNGATVPRNGLYLRASNTLGLAVNTLGQVQLTASALSPIASGGSALGTSSLMWADAFLASGAVINFNAGNYTLTHSSGLLTASGAVDVSSHINSSGNITAGAALALSWFGRSVMASPSDGVIKLSNNAGTDFSRLQFGGTTSSFPAIKRNGNYLQVRLADDSGFANYQAFAFYMANNSFITDSSDGVIRLSNNAGTDFTRLQFGGTTSSFPAIKRNGTALNFRLANDSADAPITAAAGTFSNWLTTAYNSGGVYPAYNTYYTAFGSNFSSGGSEFDIWNTVGAGFAFRSQTGASAQTRLALLNSTSFSLDSGIALTYGGVTLSNSVTGTGSMVLSASPVLTGTVYTSSLRISGANVSGNSRATLQALLNLDNSSAAAFAWNYANGPGETDLFINRGAGGIGGLNLYDFPNTTGDPTLIAKFSGAGALSVGPSGNTLTITPNTTSGTAITLVGGGTGGMTLATSGGVQVAVTSTASAVNYVAITGGATGNGVTVSALGADTNVNLVLDAKGSGIISALDHINLASGKVLQVNSTQVVGPRDTGWTAMTGTPDELTSYATATVTLAQLAGRVMALQTALTTHGLIGA